MDHLDSVRRVLAVWINHAVAPHRGIQLEPQDIEDLDEVKVMLATRIEQWEKDIHLKGLERGREEGETTLFKKMLELKYGPLPPWVQERIALADAKTIESWAANLLKVETLEAVFETTD
ncbi:MAG: DUF4351 domain-containing protein [Candidatus Thiodiazotropha sp. (ex Lucinoma kastoroae)]|nr:DUF4351 domain-containing protein [Candidatus Thiodiazotropha sp. (ex Lucinoma kastoroae)]